MRNLIGLREYDCKYRIIRNNFPPFPLFYVQPFFGYVLEIILDAQFYGGDVAEFISDNKDLGVLSTNIKCSPSNYGSAPN
jgi:hypothetical protein